MDVLLENAFRYGQKTAQTEELEASQVSFLREVRV
jgi:hypothetical protein